MPERLIRTGTALIAALFVSACGGGSGDPQRQSILRTVGLRQPPPDEFLVVERRPLTLPTNLSDLPPPDPGGRNIVDPHPREEVSALLNGAGTPVPASGALSPGETAFVAAAGGDGVDPAIRATLAAEDVALREVRRYALQTLFGQRTYDPYREELLDPFVETGRLRAAGVQTPAAPPPPPPPDRSRLF
jgi:hypothetical protein